MANRKWFRGRYLAARGVGVGRKILSVMRNKRERRPSSSTASDDVLGWWREDGTARVTSAVAELFGNSNSSPRIEQAPGPAEGFRDDLGTN